MNTRGEAPPRKENTEKTEVFMKDTEQTFKWSPNDPGAFRWLGTYSKIGNMHNTLNYEDKEKYLNEYNARFKARLELGTVPICFDKCVRDIDTKLSPDEKNCLRECFFRRVGAKDDMNFMA